MQKTDGDAYDELVEFLRCQLADARSRYEEMRTSENRRAYAAALGRFTDFVIRGMLPVPKKPAQADRSLTDLRIPQTP